MAAKKNETAKKAEVVETPVVSEVKETVAEVKEEVKAPAKRGRAKKAVTTAAKKAAPAAKKAADTAAKKTATAAKKTAAGAKKTAAAAKKAVAKEKSEVVLEFGGKSVSVDDIIAQVKKAYKADGNKGAIKKIQVYVKPEDSEAYYVINDVAEGKKIDL